MALRDMESDIIIEYKCDEGRVFGSRYYTVQPILPYWNSNDSTPMWDDMMRWCVHIYGPAPIDGVWTPNARWYANNSKFWFRKLEDRNWFMLRWQ